MRMSKDGLCAIVTGSASGLGAATASILAKGAGARIVVNYSNSKAEAEATADLCRKAGAEVVVVQGDVSRDEDCKKIAAAAAAWGGLDVLINNAGITGPQSGPADLTGDDALSVFDTNVVGMVRMMHEFLPLLQASGAPTVVNVTSGLGSFHAVHDADRIESRVVAPLYTSSKSAVTMLTVQYAKAFPGIRINAADPGYTATDLNGNSGPQTVTEGTDAVVDLATRGGKGPTGTFIDRSGTAPF
jgi:NAD(P)-dependent dehydrogenase (short-subunit alcohol dehydrogenase family)